MVARSKLMDELNRGQVAREEFLRQYCDWWPASYKAQMIVSYQMRELLECKTAIEAQMAQELQEYQDYMESPWVKIGPQSRRIDTSGLEGIELAGLGINSQRPIGIPAPIKLGGDFHNHPAVLEAQERAPKTAEWVAYEATKEAEKKMRDASRAYVADSGNKQLEAENDAATRAWQKANKEFNRLRANPLRGLLVVK